MKILIVLAMAVAFWTTGAEAAEQTARFAVDNMSCGTCPFTVRKAMQGVKGVKSVKVDFLSQTAVVIFDDAVATADAIAKASANAGYPAYLSGS